VSSGFEWLTAKIDGFGGRHFSQNQDNTRAIFFDAKVGLLAGSIPRALQALIKDAFIKPNVSYTAVVVRHNRTHMPGPAAWVVAMHNTAPCPGKSSHQYE